MAPSGASYCVTCGSREPRPPLANERERGWHGDSRGRRRSLAGAGGFRCRASRLALPAFLILTLASAALAQDARPSARDIVGPIEQRVADEPGGRSKAVKQLLQARCRSRWHREDFAPSRAPSPNS